MCSILCSKICLLRPVEVMYPYRNCWIFVWVGNVQLSCWRTVHFDWRFVVKFSWCRCFVKSRIDFTWKNIELGYSYRFELNWIDRDQNIFVIELKLLCEEGVSTTALDHLNLFIKKSFLCISSIFVSNISSSEHIFFNHIGCSTIPNHTAKHDISNVTIMALPILTTMELLCSSIPSTSFPIPFSL